MQPKLSEMITRAASLTPTTANADTRTVEMVWTTGAAVRRSSWDGDYLEELSLDPAHVVMGRLASGTAPFLMGHNGGDLNAVVGVVESARLEKGRGVATVRFAKGDPQADSVWSKVEQGILRNVSVGYRVHKFEKVEGGDTSLPTYRATSWEPYEISAVPMGADSKAHFRAEATRIMASDTNTERETERTLGILTSVRAARLETAFAEKLIADGTPLDAARKLVIDHLAARDEQVRTDNYLPVDMTGGGIGHSALDGRVRSMADALAARATGAKPQSDDAKQYAAMSIVEMARHCLELRGVSARMMSPNQVITRAMNPSSDFTVLTQETGNRVLLAGYAAYQGGVKQISRETSTNDFRAIAKIRMSEAPTLLEVKENSEVQSGPRSLPSKTTYSLKTYARTFGLSRQAIISDDLGAFDVLGSFGRAAAEFENKQLVDLLQSNPTMEDGLALFHATHGNLGTPAAISVDALSEAFKALRLAKGLDGITPIDARAKWLVVPAALEARAIQYTITFNAVQATNINPWQSRLEVIVDPRLDAVSATGWYVAADQNSVPGLEHAYLNGSPGPQLDSRQGFDTLGMEWRCILDWGCAVLDYRGLFYNAGA